VGGEGGCTYHGMVCFDHTHESGAACCIVAEGHTLAQVAPDRLEWPVSRKRPVGASHLSYG
jgi:hypothetical protein